MKGSLQVVFDTMRGETTTFFIPDAAQKNFPVDYNSPEVTGFYIQVDQQELFKKFGEPEMSGLFEGEPVGTCYESCTIAVDSLQIWNQWGGEQRGMNIGYLY